MAWTCVPPPTSKQPISSVSAVTVSPCWLSTTHTVSRTHYPTTEWSPYSERKNNVIPSKHRYNERIWIFRFLDAHISLNPGIKNPHIMNKKIRSRVIHISGFYYATNRGPCFCLLQDSKYSNLIEPIKSFWDLERQSGGRIQESKAVIIKIWLNSSLSILYYYMRCENRTYVMKAVL